MIHILKQRNRYEWLREFELAGIPCSAILAIPEVVREEQVLALEMFQHVPGEDFTLTALPLSFNGQRPHIKTTAPRLGADNDLLN